MTVVYLDSVFLFNALLDYLLFLSTARLAGIPLRRRRYLLSGVLGRLYAAAVFLPGGGFLTETLVKAGVGLLLALMLQYTLPAPFIIPLFADLGDDAEYVSTTLSLGTVLAVVLFFFLAAFSLT